MNRKEFDAMVAEARFKFIDLWRRQGEVNKAQGEVNESNEQRISALEAIVEDQAERLDILTRNVCGGVDEAGE